MKDLTPQWFEPPHQPDPEHVVSFQIKPIDLETQYTLQASIGMRGVPEWSGIVVASKYIVGWKGVRADGNDVPFSRQKLREIINGTSSFNWMVWLAQVTGKLFADSLLTDEEAKN